MKTYKIIPPNKSVVIPNVVCDSFEVKNGLATLIISEKIIAIFDMKSITGVMEVVTK